MAKPLACALARSCGSAAAILRVTEIGCSASAGAFKVALMGLL